MDACICCVRINWPVLITLQPLSDLEWNGEPRGYKVYHKISNSNDTTIISKDSLATQCDIVGLQEGVQYQVKMLAFNDVGDGPLSHIITRTTTSGNFIATFCVVICNHYS